MITGLNTGETEDYTLKEDVENPTIWKLGTMSSYLFAKLSMSAENKEIETAFKVVQIGLKGWENFNGIALETEEAEFFGQKVNVVKLSILERISITNINELCIKIMEINQQTVGESKN